jgi:hypothetical protein
MTIALATAIGAVAFVPATALAATASENHTTYLFYVGENTPDNFGPDMSMAPNGSTIAIMGAGQFNAGPNKSVSGGGTYTITDASGATVASGTWTATQMLSFVSYGNGTPQGLPAYDYGGQAQMMVTLMTDSGVFGSGVLNINCTLGTPPPGHSDRAMEEGINLRLGNGLTFNKEVGIGETIFVNPAQVP